jgi:hypothetical protein
MITFLLDRKYKILEVVKHFILPTVVVLTHCLENINFSSCMPWRRGVVVIVSANWKEDRGFESRQFLGHVT